MNMRLISAAFLLTAATISASATSVASSFIGHWTQADSQTRCSVVLGFLLRADGTASVNWMAHSGSRDAQGVTEHRRGHWKSTGDTLHLTIIDQLSDPKILRDLGKSAPITTTINVDGLIAVGGKRLDTVITDDKSRNIDGAPYEIHCSYLRDKS